MDLQAAPEGLLCKGEHQHLLSLGSKRCIVAPKQGEPHRVLHDGGVEGEHLAESLGTNAHYMIWPTQGLSKNIKPASLRNYAWIDIYVR